MSGPPPGNLKDWSKNNLVREVERLRAIVYEHAETAGEDARPNQSPGAVLTPDSAAIAGNRRTMRGVPRGVIDARKAVLLDEMDVILVDTKQDEPVAMVMSLQGRINYSHDRSEHAYLLGPDGAAALVAELIMLAGRAAGHPEAHGPLFAREFQEALEARMEEGP